MTSLQLQIPSEGSALISHYDQLGFAWEMNSVLAPQPEPPPRKPPVLLKLPLPGAKPLGHLQCSFHPEPCAVSLGAPECKEAAVCWDDHICRFQFSELLFMGTSSVCILWMKTRPFGDIESIAQGHMGLAVLVFQRKLFITVMNGTPEYVAINGR